MIALKCEPIAKTENTILAVMPSRFDCEKFMTEADLKREG
jgi:hypothetical protein